MSDSTIFPFIQPDTTASESTLAVAKELAWDFTTDTAIFSAGEPVWVYYADAVKVWAWHALHTPRWAYEMYSGDFGHDLQALIGTGWSDDLKTVEAQQYLTECLTASPYITAVRDVTVSFADDVLTAAFCIDTVYGTISMEV